MSESLIDFEYLNEISGGDPTYIYELLTIYLDNTPPGIIDLEKLIRDTDDWEAIYKKAHFLKSSAGIVKVRGMYEGLLTIETKGREQLKKIENGEATESKETFIRLLEDILAPFNEALPIIEAVRDKNKPQ